MRRSAESSRRGAPATDAAAVAARAVQAAETTHSTVAKRGESSAEIGNVSATGVVSW
ncbi:hypothetical protein [Couchioplanes azureus]|uniref:hypothetical protein n=1 Tax=Couchioplanes caeruleus TaxID=56438 RepID=UPI00166FCEBD|nr:hypothetical protein [Couchioplanes caeruleus]GGQ83267.1 hypothetical protein GCM10010166_61940 [Couchioplanes caeruleus subsp. azureus]